MTVFGQADMGQVVPGLPQPFGDFGALTQMGPMHSPGAQNLVRPLGTLQQARIVQGPFRTRRFSQILGPGRAKGKDIDHPHRAEPHLPRPPLAPLDRGVIAQLIRRRGVQHHKEKLSRGRGPRTGQGIAVIPAG